MEENNSLNGIQCIKIVQGSVVQNLIVQKIQDPTLRKPTDQYTRKFNLSIIIFKTIVFKLNTNKTDKFKTHKETHFAGQTQANGAKLSL